MVKIRSERGGWLVLPFSLLWNLARFLLLLYILIWSSHVMAEDESHATKTWQTIGELSESEREAIDLRTETPRNTAIPYLPAETYPFAPPYTAEEIGYLAFGLDTLRPRFSHIWPSTGLSMTACGYIAYTWKNNTAVLYRPKDGNELFRFPAGKESMRAFTQFTNPPESAGQQQLWLEYRTEQDFSKKRERYSYRPTLR